jgi:hypothetical protein
MKEILALKARIAENITLGDLLVRDGKITGSLSEEQFSCSFHGRDLKKSARYYRETDSSYCWTCKKRWDIFSYLEQKEAMTFGQALEYLVKFYNIPTRDLPDAIEEAQRKRIEAPRIKINSDKLAQEKLFGAIRHLRGHVPDERYERLVFAFMLLKHTTADDKKAEGAEILRKAVLKVAGEARHAG